MHKIFGIKEKCKYMDRNGAYLIPMKDGKIAVVQSQKGYFFIGGGLMDHENHMECIQREAMEEIGYSVCVKERICSAEAYLLHPDIGHFHPIQTYYSGEILTKETKQTEKKHHLVWLKYKNLKGNMFVPMQNWALEYYFEQFIKSKK